MALVMLRLLRTSDSEDVEEQERLLAESNSYFELAVTHLSDLSSDSTSTLLEMQLNAVMDLHHHQVRPFSLLPASYELTHCTAGSLRRHVSLRGPLRW